MTRLRTLLGAWLVGGTIAVACTFPSPVLRDDPVDATTVTDGNSPDRSMGPDTSTTEAGLPDGGGGLDASNPDAVAPLDADKVDGDATVTAPDGQVVDCDEDKDRYLKSGGVCGGFDCNDQNGNVRPDREYNTLAPLPGSGPGTNGDWNCNGAVEYQLKVGVNPSCPSILGGGCANAGFVDPQPTCGSNARYVECTQAGIACNKTKDTMQPVACR